jgi:hypothetical protein
MKISAFSSLCMMCLLSTPFVSARPVRIVNGNGEDSLESINNSNNNNNNNNNKPEAKVPSPRIRISHASASVADLDSFSSEERSETNHESERTVSVSAPKLLHIPPKASRSISSGKRSETSKTVTTTVSAPRIHIPKASPAASIVPPPLENGGGKNLRLFGLNHPTNEPLTQAEAIVLEKTIRDAFDKIHHKEHGVAADSDVTHGEDARPLLRGTRRQSRPPFSMRS